ncbi:MAG: hypothetical protein ACTHQ3_17510 [Motilibacteraceae bacterium]
MKVKKSLFLAPMLAPVLLPLALAAPASAATNGTYTFQMDSLNNSGATATAQVTLNGTQLHVVIDGHGFVPNAPHAQHLHGDLSGKTFDCPTPAEAKASDKNGDGHLSTTEAAGFYGPVMIALTTKGDTSMNSALAVDRFPVADAKGNLHYDRTITIDQKTADNLKNLHIVDHGVDYNGNGKYDGDAKSDLDPSLPAEATDPAACGALHLAQVSNTPMGGVNTGTGSSGPADLPAIVFGGGALAGAGALLVARRRTAAGSR